MYSETILILIALRDDIVEKLIKILLDHQIEKIKMIHIFNYFFDSKDYDIEKIITCDFEEFISKKWDFIKNEKYYQESPVDILERFDENDFDFLEETGYKTENHLYIDIDTYLYEGIVRKYGIGDLLVRPSN